MKKTKTPKPKYSVLQNTGFMLGCAWRIWKPLLLELLLMILAVAGQSITELLIAPVILGKLETGAALDQLLGVIALFTLLLALCAAVQNGLSQPAMLSRIKVRLAILGMLSEKRSLTSYPNTLDTNFIAMSEKADTSCDSNRSATEAVWKTLQLLAANLICFFVYLAMLTGLPVWILLLIVVTSAASYFVTKRINEWGYRHRSEELAYSKKLNYIDNISKSREYAKDIRMFGLRAWIEDLWDSTVRLYSAFLRRREGTYIWANVLDLVLTFARNALAYAYLIRLTLAQGLPASQFLLYFSALSGFAQWVSGILSQFSTLHKQSLELANIREFLDWPEPFRFEDGEPLACDPDASYSLELKDVSFRYPGAEKDTLTHMNLTIRPGEKLAIVGLNGAGKTTLVKLLCGFLDPTQGAVLLNGEDIRKYDRRDYYRLFSAVFQDFSVLEAPLAQNVAQSIDHIDEARVWQCLELAGLTEKVRSLPKQLQTPIGRQVYEDGVELSGGQTQRLMLARALYKNAPILVLDEPTAALDPIAESDIYQKYNDISAGKTSVFISHRLASTRFCDRILFLKDGKIAEEGTHESLLKLGGGYAELFEVQSKYYRDDRKEGANEHD